MIYVKDGKTSTCSKLVLDGRIVLNPSPEQIIAAGWTVYEPPKPKPRTNKDVESDRRYAYKEESDSYFIAYQAYHELGLTDKAAEAKQLWLAKREEIQQRIPKIEE